MFSHIPLEEPTAQIRLLTFLPSADDEVHLTIDTHTLSQAPPYNAISYTWGEPGNESPVYIDRAPFQVRKNCLKALRQIRNHEPARAFWLDSVCINQKDLEEKGKQVQLMWSIYSRATVVLAYVGEHEDDSESLMRFAHEVGGRGWPLPERPEEDTPWLEWLMSYEQAGIASLVHAFDCFSFRSYWRRLWIVQELASKISDANEPIRVLCGFDSIPWSNVKLLEGVLTKVVGQLQYRERISKVTKEQKAGGYSGLSLLFSGLGINHEIGDAMFIFGTFGCADPRDRFYALLHLVNPDQHAGRLKPDYRISLFELAKVVCEVVSYRYTGVVLKMFGIDSQYPELQALVKERSKESWSSSANSTPKITKLLDAKGHVDPTKSFAPYVVLEDGKTGGLKAALEIHLANLVNVRLENELKDLHRKQAHSFSDIKTLSVDGPPVGLLCAQARAGDLLVPLSAQPKHVVLVLRRRADQVFDVVGQGILWDGYTVPDTRDRGAVRAKVEVSLYAEDLVLLFAQDAVPHRWSEDYNKGLEVFDPVGRLQRVVTRPLGSPSGAVTLKELSEA